MKRAAEAALFILVGVAGFEPAASWTRTMRDTKLRHTPIDRYIIMRNLKIVKPFHGKTQKQTGKLKYFMNRPMFFLKGSAGFCIMDTTILKGEYHYV